MASRHLAPLPEPWLAPMNALFVAVNESAVTDLSLQERRRRLEITPWPWTGYEAAGLTRQAGIYAATAIRIQAQRTPTARRSGWETAVLDHLSVHVITHWDQDERLGAALALRARWSQLDPGSDQAFKRVTAWLVQSSGPELARSTGRLCTYVLGTELPAAVLERVRHEVHRPTCSARHRDRQLHGRPSRRQASDDGAQDPS
jgi:hypothetical protein